MSHKLSRSSKNIFVAARSDFIRSIRELNLFSDNPFWSPALNYAEQILSTRLFLLFLFVSLLVITTYTSLVIRTHTVTMERFSLSDFERIEARYPGTISVHCTQVSTPLEKLIHLPIKFHPICSSSFIRDTWISSLFLSNATSHNILDFRTFTFAQFQALALLCHTARQAVNDGYRTFNSTHLTTSRLRSRTEFNEIVDVLTTNLRDNLVANENRTVRIVLMSIAQNRLMSALRTNFYIRSDASQDEFVIHNGIYLTENGTVSSACDCRLEGNQCAYPAGAFYNWTVPELDQPAKSNPPPRFQIPGIMAGCLPLESIRKSTLECLYQQSCIDILSLQPKISRPKPLQISSSKFPSNLTIATMFDASLFVESWEHKSSFEDYFNACAPRSLTYNYQGRYRLAAIFTLCVGAFGGLVRVWQLITPAIVKTGHLIKRKKQQKRPSIPSDQPDIEQAIIQMAPKAINKAVADHVHQTIYTLNLFTLDKRDDIEEQYVGIIATRLYILFLLFGLVILGFSTSLLKRIQTNTVTSPSLNEFERLKSLYSSTLVCSCSHHSISYGRIMSISPRYHQLCSSQFLEETWLSYFHLPEVKLNTTLFIGLDFRISGQSLFSSMGHLCQTAKETVENAHRLFRSRRFVTAHTLSRTQFNGEIKARRKQFQQQTIASFINLLELIRSSIRTNELVSDLLTTNGFSYLFDNRTSKWQPRFRHRALYNSSCSCALSSECTRPQGFYLQSDDRMSDPKVIIPGLVLGCYTINSLLLSTLECLYEQKCIKLIIDKCEFDAVGLFLPLDIRTTRIRPLRKKNSRFSPNTRMESIVSQLFIEDWRATENFTAYYTRCAPKQCTYSIIRRFDWPYMAAMMLGLYSGLSAILEIILPHFVRHIRQQSKKQRYNTNNPQTTDGHIQSFVATKTTRSFHKIYQSLRSLNLYADKSLPTAEQKEHEEVIATRIYLILILLSLLAALLYTGPLSKEEKTLKIKLPTPDTVNDLYTKNISTLSCPCSTAAIPHSKFLSIIPEYHSICSSKYVQLLYRTDLFNKNDRISRELSAHYGVLASLCQQAHRIINSAQEEFAARDLISVETMTRSSFISQTEALVSTFIIEIPADYRRTLTFITRSFGVNQLFNILTSNWKLNFTDENEHYILSTYPRRFSSSNCTCSTSFDCTEKVLENIVSGCFPFDGFRLSKFENISFGQLNDKLFIETWKNESNYTAYFETCRPLECRYTVPGRNNLLVIFTTILELYGGLTYVLHLIVGQSLLVYCWWIKRRTEGQIKATSTSLVIM